MRATLLGGLLGAGFLTVLGPVPAATAACAPNVHVARYMWGTITAQGTFNGCTIRQGDRLCIQKEVGYNSWSSTVVCRGPLELNGTVDTFPTGCANHPSYAGKYRAYAVVNGRAYASANFWCPSDY